MLSLAIVVAAVFLVLAVGTYAYTRGWNDGYSHGYLEMKTRKTTGGMR